MGVKAHGATRSTSMWRKRNVALSTAESSALRSISVVAGRPMASKFFPQPRSTSRSGRLLRPATPTVAPAQVQVATCDLMVGHKLQFDMRDRSGMLLLAVGSEITPEFKERLLAHNISAVSCHVADVAPAAAASDVPATAQGEKSNVAGGAAWPDLEHGLPFLNNRGPALRSMYTDCRGQPRDLALVAAISEERNEAVTLVDDLMQRTSRGREQSVAPMMQTLQRAIRSMAADADVAIGQSLEFCGPRSLATHCHDLAQLSMAMAVELGLNRDNVTRVGLTGLLHDWGWMRVPQAIRELQRPFTESELLEVYKHPAHSLDILGRLSGLPTHISLVSYQVHEKLNGTGYPRRKMGNTIHLFARILHVADDYLTLTTPTGYRPAIHPYVAMRALLQQQDGRAADRNVLRALLRVLSMFPIGSLVELSDGTIARVIRANGDQYVSPVVERPCANADEVPDEAASDADAVGPLHTAGADPAATETEVIDLSASALKIVGPAIDERLTATEVLPGLRAFTRVDEGHALSGPRLFQASSSTHERQRLTIGE